jgi:hypothetical protein
MSESHAAPSTPAHVPAATGSAGAQNKKYDYVRVRICLPGNTMTTISLDRGLVERAARALGSEMKAREVAMAAALQYVEGQSPARTRSGFAARALQRAALARHGASS